MRLKFAVSVVAVAFTVGVSAFMATPTFAGDHRAHRDRARTHHPGYLAPHQRDYSGYLDPRSGHYDPEFQRNRENFGFSGRDPSRIGGMDPSLHPPGIGR